MRVRRGRLLSWLAIQALEHERNLRVQVVSPLAFEDSLHDVLDSVVAPVRRGLEVRAFSRERQRVVLLASRLTLRRLGRLATTVSHFATKRRADDKTDGDPQPPPH